MTGDRVRYGEGLYIGYRWYEARDLPVSFPFGHGLSYTTFRYDDARTSATTLADVHGLTVAVDVTNTGGRRGTEVVQVYVRDVEASVQRPHKELRGFAKVRLEPGETRTVEVRLEPRAFAFWDVRRQAWVTEAGAFEILIGSSSAAIHAVIPVTVVESAALPSTLTDMSPLQDWLGDAAGRPAALELVRSLAPILGGVFGKAVTDPDDLDPHFHSYFSAMPIRDLLEFAAPAGGPEPDARLRRAHRAHCEPPCRLIPPTRLRSSEPRASDRMARSIEIQGEPLAVDLYEPARHRGDALLIHGYTGSKEDFADVGPFLAGRGYRVVAFDNRGQNESAHSERDDAYTISSLACDAIELADRFTLERPHLLGHSFGGLVAQRAVKMMPSRWASLTLFCTGPDGRSGLADLTEIIRFRIDGGQHRGDRRPRHRDPWRTESGRSRLSDLQSDDP